MSVLLWCLFCIGIRAQGPASPPPSPTFKGSWSDSNRLLGATANEKFGRHLAISGDGTKLIVGTEKGIARLYNYSGGTLELAYEVNGDQDDATGWTVAISDDGRRFAVSHQNWDYGSTTNNVGRVEIYELTSGTWSVLAQFQTNEIGDFFGASVALSGDGQTLAVGSMGSSILQGKVTIFKYNTSTTNWDSQEIKGNNYELIGMYIGAELSLSQNGSICAFGSWNAQKTKDEIGLVRVYEDITTGTYVQMGEDILSGETDNVRFGTSVALSSNGERVVIGAPQTEVDSKQNSGAVRVYEWNSTAWKQLGNTIQGGTSVGARNGRTVDISGDGTRIITGAHTNKVSGQVKTGTAMIFDYNEEQQMWEAIAPNLNGASSNNNFGSSVSITASGTTIVVGEASYDGGGRSDRGAANLYEFAPYSPPPSAPPSSSSSSSSSAALNGDPHLLFSHGQRADFRGEAGKIFAFVSSPGFALNVLIVNSSFRVASALIHGTYISEMYVRCGGTLMVHNATNATEHGYGWHAVKVLCPGSKRFRYVYPHTRWNCSGETASVHVVYSTTIFNCGSWVVTSTVQPVARHVSGVSRNLDIQVSGIDYAHGVMGQNFANPRSGNTDKYPTRGVFVTRAQAEGAIDGTHSDYVVDTEFGTDFRFSLYDKPAGATVDWRATRHGIASA